MWLVKPLLLLSGAVAASAQVTVYGQLPLGQTLSTAPWQTTTVRAAYNTTRLRVPERPEGQFNTRFTIQLQPNPAALPPGSVSIPHVGHGFWGFSIEMSVINQVLGKNSSYLNVPFLNLLANLEERAGGVVVRLGGNTQEYAIMVEQDDPRLAPGLSYGKTKSSSTGTTNTPAVLYTKEMLYSAGNISQKVNVDWFLGIPFDDPVNWRTDIAVWGQAILGDRLLGMQAANEPDFYVAFNRRPPPYDPPDYKREFGQLIQHIDNHPNIPRKNILIGPSTSGQVDNFHPEDLFAIGWLDDFQSHLYGVTVEHYSHDNCIANYAVDKTGAKDPQQYLPTYLTHRHIVDLIAPYREVSVQAQRYNKPLMMFETNTGSCGGFPGISNSYTAAIWGLDYGLQMAWGNFTHGMIHVGGQNVFYNPFTASRTEHAAFNKWTVGPIFYSALILAEALGKTNTARVHDLHPNGDYAGTPAYAIYENDRLTKVALFNYVSDLSGASNLQVTLTVERVPPSVKVKYLLATTVVEKDNITWAGQTFGNVYEADGRLRGDLNVTDIPCDVGQNICVIPMPAPAFALVFFDSNDPMVTVSQAAATFPTTAYIKPINTATYERSALETSNGHKGAADNVNRARTNFEYRKLHYDSGAMSDNRRQVGFASLAVVVVALLSGLGLTMRV